jgi:hypothetical protein
MFGVGGCFLSMSLVCFSFNIIIVAISSDISVRIIQGNDLLYNPKFWGRFNFVFTKISFSTPIKCERKQSNAILCMCNAGYEVTCIVNLLDDLNLLFFLKCN